jgi:glycosyltransferase involved in cell wall biosynthesis
MSSPDSTSSARPIHVLTLTPFYPSAQDGANGCFIAESSACLEENGVKNTIFAMQPAYRGRRKGTGRAPHAEWISYLGPPGNPGLAASGVFVYARILSAVRRLHNATGIDLIHAHAPLPCGHAAALLSRELRVPFVVSVHGLDVFSSANAGGCARRWNRRVSEMVYREARRTICVSQRVRDEILTGIGAHCRALVVYNGVDPNLFSPGSDSATCEPTILSVGNLIPTKGHELLLRAVAVLKRTIAGVTCDIVGDGPERTRLQQVARDLQISDRTTFVGRQSRASVAEFLRRSKIFCLPSRYEGLGCVYLEAMAAGKPAVGCRGQGIAEIIQHNVNGCLVDPGNLDGLVTTIAKLMEDAATTRRIASAGRRTVLNGFTLSHQAQRLNQVYRECLA